ncbi:hypothetical protein HYW18_02215 [Candidatus Uhrbacteria bacterium]|nr:hypothetical protein [Candidatus Uhrbacteria bacterium]
MRIFTTLLVLLALPTAAEAQTTLYYDGVSLERALAALVSEGVDTSSIAPVWISDVTLPASVQESGDPFWVVGGFPGRGCQTGRVPFHQNFVEYTTKAKEALVALDLEEADIYLDDLVAALPCATEGLKPEELARVLTLRGIHAHWTAGAAVARTLFRQSIVLRGHPEWDSDFGAELEAVYNTAVAEAESESRVAIRYSLAGLTLTAFLVDGRDHLVHVGEEVGGLSVLPGEHVMQWRIEDGPWQTRLWNVQNGAHIVSMEGIRHLLRRRPDDVDARLVQETLFGREKGNVTVAVWPEGEESPPFIYTYDRNAKRPLTYLAGAPVERYTSRHDVTSGPVGLAISAGYLFYGTSWVDIAVLGDFRLKGPVELELGGEAAFSGYGSVPLLLPALRAGLRLSLRPERQVKPWVGMQARFTFSNLPGTSPARVGPIAMGGVEIPLWPSKAAGLRIEIGGGALLAVGEPPVPSVGASIGLVLRKAHWKE